MSDPRLNSIHLESFRREEFRRAREMLLGSIGDQTQNLAGIAQLDRGPPAESRTLHQTSADRLPAGQDYVLVEKDAIYRLKVGLNTIGRLSDNDVVIPDPYLSRRHCAVLVHATKGCELHDVASKNGTFLNGRRIDGPTAINSGDEIRICDRQLVFLHRSKLDEPGPSDATMID
jgi:FHA domain